MNNIGGREFNRVIRRLVSDESSSTECGTTVATLMLSAGVPAHVVSRRLGHSKISTTLDVYAHALPSMQQDAAARLAAMIHR